MAEPIFKINSERVYFEYSEVKTFKNILKLYLTVITLRFCGILQGETTLLKNTCSLVSEFDAVTAR